MFTPEMHLTYLANSSGTPTNRKPNIALTMHFVGTDEIITAGDHSGTATRRETIAAMASHVIDHNKFLGTTAFNAVSVYEGDPHGVGITELPAPSLDIMLELLELIEAPNPPQ